MEFWDFIKYLSLSIIIVAVAVARDAIISEILSPEKENDDIEDMKNTPKK